METQAVIKERKGLAAVRGRASAQECKDGLSAVGDALYVIGGKWKLPIIIALSDNGSKRFNELQRLIKGISARVLSNELKQLEITGFVKRTVYQDSSVVIEYELTEYSSTLSDVLRSLREWGVMHRKRIRENVNK